MGIELQAVTQKYGDLIALKNINLSIAEGEMIAVIGPSGCGKTTLLKTIAGLLPLHQGRILLNGTDISQMVPQDRNAVLVFQNYALFPHMTVEENIAYGLRLRKTERTQMRARVEEILEKTELSNLNKRKISELSGGQQQRVALARALVIEPSILLFDEPLSNLDQRLRVAMRKKIRQIQLEYGISSIYVTHDQEEAMSIADRIVVLKDGLIEQIGTPSEVYLKPRNRFVAEFMAVANIVNLNEHDEISRRLSMEIDLAALQNTGSCLEDSTNQPCYLMFRPEDIEIRNDGEFTGTIIWQETIGAINKLTIDYQGTNIFAEIGNYFKSGLDIKTGDKVKFSLDMQSAHILEK